MIDMHIHTTYSDGTSLVDEIISYTKNFDLFSITDHDNINACRRVVANNFVSGSEISIRGSQLSFDNLEFHFLIYDFDLNDVRLNSNLDEINYYNNHSFFEEFKKIICVNSFNINPCILEKFKDCTLSKTALSRILYENNIGSSVQDVYNNYVKEYCNIKKCYMDFYKLIDIIKSNHAFMILAHPFSYGLSNNDLDILMNKLYTNEIDGIELSFDNVKKSIEYIKKYNFLYSLGSDYHGIEFDKCNIIGIDDSIYKNDDNYIKNKILRR